MSLSDLYSIGARIQKLRKERGWTQQVLADKIPVERSTLAKWEKGLQDFKSENIIRVADVFDVTCDYLLRGVIAENVTVHKDLGLSDEVIEALNLIYQPKPELMEIINTFMYSDNFYRFINAARTFRSGYKILWEEYEKLVEYRKRNKVEIQTDENDDYDYDSDDYIDPPPETLLDLIYEVECLMNFKNSKERFKYKAWTGSLVKDKYICDKYLIEAVDKMGNHEELSTSLIDTFVEVGRSIAKAEKEGKRKPSTPTEKEKKEYDDWLAENFPFGKR